MTDIFIISVRKTEKGQSLLFHNAWDTTFVAPLLCSRLTLFVIGWRLYQIFFRYCEEREGKLHQSSKFLFHAAASWRQWNYVPADITYVSLPAEATPYIFQTVLPRVRMELFEVTKGKILEGLKLYRPKGYKLTHREECRSDFSYEGKPVLLSPPVIDAQASLQSCNANFPRLNNPCETFP